MPEEIQRRELIDIYVEKITARFVTLERDDIETCVKIAMGEFDMMVTSVFGDAAALQEVVVICQGVAVATAVLWFKTYDKVSIFRGDLEARIDNMLDDVKNMIDYTAWHEARLAEAKKNKKKSKR